MDYQQREALKDKATIGAVGAVAGATAWWLLASLLGWVSPTTAQQRTSDAVQAKVDQVLAPFCADRLIANKEALAKFIKASGRYDRDEIVQNAIPKIGSTRVDYMLSDLCAGIINAQIKNSPPNLQASSKKG
jgi:hypothetical protein